MNCLCAICVDRNQRAFLAQMTSFVVRYDVIHHSFPISSQYLMTYVGLTALIFQYQGYLAGMVILCVRKTRCYFSIEA